MESFTPANFFNELDWEKEENDKNLTPMKSFYKGKTVFLTGGTGFLGQLYVEKLLRCDVKHIYLLGRAKKGKTAEERIKETFVGVHFLKLYDHDPDYLKRISIIDGDMGKLNVGISESDQNELIENVEIVIHAAADVRFDQKLVKLLLINLRGTREMLELTARMKKILAFTFISTAYSHCVRSFVEEKFYDSPVDPEVMIQIGELHSESHIFEIMTERIIRPWPNTYTYTKSLTEELVRRYCTKFPICIIRPSIVISTHEDPAPAWCNNVYGLNGVCVANGLGVLRVLPLNKDLVGDIVCADFVINSTLAALWVTHEDSVQAIISNGVVKKDPEIYHVCTSTDRPVTWGTIRRSLEKAFAENPSKSALWKQCSNYITNPFWFTYLTIFYHAIPAALIDVAHKIMGKSLRVIPVYRKVQRFTVAISYFMQLDLLFDNTNMKRVLNRMSPEDKEFFPSDVRRYNWSAFVYDYVAGLKVYIGLESLDKTDKAKRKYKMLIVLHYLVLCVYYGLHIALFSFLADKLGLFRYVRSNVHEAYAFLKNPQMAY